MDQDIYELLEIPKERHFTRRNSSGKPSVTFLGNEHVKGFLLVKCRSFGISKSS